MREGACPKCDSADVFMRRSGLKWRMAEPRIEISYPGLVGKVKVSRIEAYVCTHCGYFETYLVNPRALAKIARKWKRVVPGEADRPLLATEDEEVAPRRREPTLGDAPADYPAGESGAAEGDAVRPAEKPKNFFARALDRAKAATAGLLKRKG